MFPAPLGAHSPTFLLWTKQGRDGTESEDVGGDTKHAFNTGGPGPAVCKSTSKVIGSENKLCGPVFKRLARPGSIQTGAYSNHKRLASPGSIQSFAARSAARKNGGIQSIQIVLRRPQRREKNGPIQTSGVTQLYVFNRSRRTAPRKVNILRTGSRKNGVYSNVWSVGQRYQRCAPRKKMDAYSNLCSRRYYSIVRAHCKRVEDYSEVCERSPAVPSDPRAVGPRAGGPECCSGARSRREKRRHWYVRATWVTPRSVPCQSLIAAKQRGHAE